MSTPMPVAACNSLSSAVIRHPLPVPRSSNRIGASRSRTAERDGLNKGFTVGTGIEDRVRQFEGQTPELSLADDPRDGFTIEAPRYETLETANVIMCDNVFPTTSETCRVAIHGMT